MTTSVKAPWREHVTELPYHLEYFQGTMYEAVKEVAEKYPEYTALNFMGKSVTYRKLMEEIRRCAKALRSLGIRKDDVITIAMPNCLQAIYAFYAINCIGAVSNMVHPLSAEKELEFYLNCSGSIAALTLDQFYGKFEAIVENTGLRHLIVSGITDELPAYFQAAYKVTEGRKIKRVPKSDIVIKWKDLVRRGRPSNWDYSVKKGKHDTAAILYSGGTTGTTKGIELTNLNFNASGAQLTGTNPMFRPGDKMLAAMPIFHGFGLSVCIHAMLINGGCSILVPRFTAESYAKLIIKHRCNFIAGVPTLFEALTRLETLQRADLSCLKGIYSGGDSLSVSLKKKIDSFLEDRNCRVQVREGYGATETVGACCLTPPSMHKEGSIGIPFPDTYIKIVRPGTEEEMPYGQEGEITISGPTVMKAYLNNPEETEQTLREHDDGRKWLSTGDLGVMDEEGFVYFKGRSKRIIISSGYNIYPAQMESVLDSNKMIRRSCVIGVPDDYKMHKVKAFVVLEEGVSANEDTWFKLMAYCKKNFAKYAMPYDIEFRDALPVTLIGKVAYRELEEEELRKIADAAEQSPDNVNE